MASRNTISASCSGVSDVDARTIKLLEDRDEMLKLFQQIYDELAENQNAYQAKHLAYAALCRYGKK